MSALPPETCLWYSWVYQVRAGLQWDLSEFMSLIGNIQYVHDENMTRLVIDAVGERREFQRPVPSDNSSWPLTTNRIPHL